MTTEHLKPISPIETSVAQRNSSAYVLFHPEHVSEAQTICALRFKGYEYEEAVGLVEPGEVGMGLAQLVKPIVDTRMFHSDQNLNFASFFGLQRFLHKWGGERHTKYSDEYFAYDLLFLHLYHLDPPPDFTDRAYNARWHQKFADSTPMLHKFHAVACR